VWLEDGVWGPPTVFRETRAATLHFYAEPEQFRPVDHFTGEFRKATQLFKGMDVSIRFPVTMAKLEAAEYPSKDLAANETLSLMERQFVLRSLATMYKEDAFAGLPAPSEGGSGGVLCAPCPGRPSGN
jgi:hypothetical protein